MAGEEENDDHFPSLEELLGHAGEAQKSLPTVSIFNHSNGKADNAIEHPTLIDCDNPPTSGAKGDGDKCGEADGCSRVHPNSDGSISEEQGGEQSSPNTPPTSVPGSEVGYVSYNLRSLISLLTEARNLELPPFAKRQIILSPVLHLFFHHDYPLIPSSRQYPVHRKDQETAPSTISALVPPMKEKRRQTQVTGTMQTGTMQMGTTQMGIHEMGTGRLRALRAFRFPLSVRQAMQV